MSYVHTKRIKGHDYQYESESYRENGKHKTRHVRYIGKLGSTYHSNNFNLNKTVQKLGTTNDIYSSGFILPNGKMIDMSAPNTNIRVMSHGEVALMYSKKKYDTHYEAVDDFIKEKHLMRITTQRDNSTIFIEIKNKPTQKQMDIIKNNSKGKNITLDYNDKTKGFFKYSEFENYINKN